MCKVEKYQLKAALQVLLPIFEFRRSSMIWLRIDMLKIIGARAKAYDFSIGIY